MPVTSVPMNAPVALLSDTILVAPFTKPLIASPSTVLPPTAVTGPVD